MIGQTLSHFKIVAKLGQGGMGEVYRAEDTTLGREVAIKLLPEAVATDSERRSRFEREAKLLASLNHPNISAIYSFETAESSSALDQSRASAPIFFLVMELVEGETFADRIGKGAIPLADALHLADQVTDALEYAHGQGIVHRDLKPANIKITPEGKVKVLDFGLAKALEAPRAGSGTWTGSEPPTLTLQATREGVLLGTAAYMSPEQARGQQADSRADIWAFGCVLYEMLTAEKVFDGQTASDTLVAILDRDPDWARLPGDTPSSIRRLLSRCLKKDHSHRLRDIGDAHLEIEDAEEGPLRSEPDEATSTVRRQSSWVGRLLVLVAIAASMAAVWAVMNRPGHRGGSEVNVSRWTVDLDEPLKLAIHGRSNPLAISPDGTRLAFVAEDKGISRLYMRSSEQFGLSEIPQTEGARNPFFSPDGDWVGFSTGDRLLKVPVAGGAPREICTTPLDDLGSSWAANDTIVFGLYGAGLSRVAAEGGTPEQITELDYANGEVQHRWPQFLPGGNSVLFTVASDRGARVAVVSLSTGKRHFVGDLTEVVRARYLEPGYLVYAQGARLMALPFDPSTATPTGEPTPVLKGVASRPDLGNSYFAISTNGSLLYLPGSTTGDLELVWADREGRLSAAVEDRRSYTHPRLSPDGKRIAVAVGSEVGTRHIWFYDLERGTRTILPSDGSTGNPTWSPDGTEVVFSSNLAGSWNLYAAPTDGSSGGRLLLERDNEQWVGQWTEDGRYFSFYDVTAESGRDIWYFGRGDTKPQPYLVTPYNERSPRFSPNGRWLAYVSNESGRDEIYVESFPERSRKWTISTNGGSEPLWSKNGEELYYRQGDQMMVVEVESADVFAVSRPRILFPGSFEVGVAGNPSYDVSADGQKFLMMRRGEDASPTQLRIVLNWIQEVERLINGDV